MEAIHTTREFNQNNPQFGVPKRLLIKPTVALAIALTIVGVAGYLTRCSPQLAITQTASAQDISGKDQSKNSSGPETPY